MNKLFFYLSFFAFIFIITSESCRKLSKPDILELEFSYNNAKEKFYTVADTANTVVKKIINKLKAKDSNGKLAVRVSKSSGFPYWDKAVLITKTSKIAGKGTTSTVDTNYVFVPLVPEGSKEVEGAIACKVVGDSVTANFLNEKDYLNYGFSSSEHRNASNLVNLMIFLQNKVFGTESFVIYDKRLLSKNNDTLNTSRTELITFKSVNGHPSENITGRYYAKYESLEFCIIYGYYGCPIPSHQGQLCTDHSQYYTTQQCSNFLFWIDDGGGSGSSSGGTGNGSSGGGSTGGGGTGGPPTGSTSTVQYLHQELYLTDAEVSFLDTHPFASEETYNYITSSDGILTETEMKRLAQSHYGYMMVDNSYLDYCQIRYDELAQNPRSRKIPWFHYMGINVTDPDLYSLIQDLKLHTQQAYYLLNNPVLKQNVKDLVNKNYSDLTLADKELLVKEFLKEIEVNPTLKELVEEYKNSEAVFHPWMSALFKELALELGWKVISKYIPGYGDWQSIKDAIEEAKDGDWLGALGEILNIVKKKVPALAVIDAIVDVWHLTPLVNKAWKAFDKIKELPVSAFNGLLTTIKSKTGGLIGKLFHDDFNPGASQSFLNVSPTQASSFFDEFAQKLGKNVNATSSGGGWFDIDGIRVNFYFDASSQPHLPTIEFIFPTGKRYKIRFID